jgi:excisionase family DNA binding protein
MQSKKARRKAIQLWSEDRIDGNGIPRRYLSVANSAIYAECSESQIRQLLAKGLLPRYKFGSRTLIQISDLDQHVKPSA